MRKNVYLTVSVLVGTSFILDSLWQPDNNKVLHRLLFSSRTICYENLFTNAGYCISDLF